MADYVFMDSYKDGDWWDIGDFGTSNYYEETYISFTVSAMSANARRVRAKYPQSPLLSTKIIGTDAPTTFPTGYTANAELIFVVAHPDNPAGIKAFISGAYLRLVMCDDDYQSWDDSTPIRFAIIDVNMGYIRGTWAYSARQFSYTKSDAYYHFDQDSSTGLWYVSNAYTPGQAGWGNGAYDGSGSLILRSTTDALGLAACNDGIWRAPIDADSDYTDTTSTSGGYGGQGAHDHTSDTVGIPAIPSAGVLSAGFIKAYKITSGQLANLGSVLFPDPASAATDVMTAIENLLDTYMYSRRIDYIIDCHIIPVSPSVGSTANITLGGKDTGVRASLALDDYVDFDCGSLTIPENFANFIDYAGTRARLYLPFVGFVDIQNEYWQSGTLSVYYRFNIIDGSFMAFVVSSSSKSALSGSVIAQYGGNCCVHLPVTGPNYASMITGLITGSMALAASAASGNTVGIATSALSLTQQRPEVAQSNNYNSSTSFLGARTPYLLIERQVPSYAAYYNQDNGLPANVTVALSTLTGYAVIEDIMLEIDGALADDLEELRQLLADGVYF